MVLTKSLPEALRRAAHLIDCPMIAPQAFNEPREIVLDAQTTLDD